MPFQITKNDYKKVLQYYNVSIPNTPKQLKETAENLLSDKLCRCIRKVKKSVRMKNKSLSKNEALQSGVGICRDSVLHKKRIDVYGFTCDKTRKLRRYPNKSYSLAKFRKQPKTLKMKLSTTNEKKKSKQTRSKRKKYQRV